MIPGVCEIGGRTAQVAQVDQLLQIRVPVSGDAYALHVRQARHTGLAKVTPGRYVRAEAPCGPDPGACFAALRDDVDACVERLENDRAAGTDPAAAGQEFDLDALVAAAALECAKSGDRYHTGLAAEPGRRVTASIGVEAGAVVCRTVLCRLSEPPAFVRYALSHFLLELNGRLRVARAGLWDDRAVLEACIPFGLATPRFVEHALEALSAGSRVARRECAALTDHHLAHEYLDCQWKGD